MSIETIPRWKAYEFDPAILDNDAAQTISRIERLAPAIGRIAVTGGGQSTYFRFHGQYSPEDIDQLEEFYALLRSYYGIPKSQPVFPKREPTQASEPTVQGEEMIDGE